jgi:tetratricopeptide (TPR) repeat protein
MDINRVISEIQYYSQDKTSDFRKVIQMTQNLIDLGYRHSSIHFFKGRAHQELREHSQAIPSYKESIKYSDDVVTDGYSWTKILSSNNLANLYFDLDLYDECMNTSEHNIRFFENDSRMEANKVYYANALYLTAHCIYLKAGETNGIDRNGLLGQVKLLRYQQLVAYGIRCIAAAIDLSPNNVDYLFVAGMLYKLNGDLNNARLNFTKAANLGDSQSRIQLSKI